VTALANGAEAIIPVRTLKEAYALRKNHREHLLAGERGGIKPEGFDLGNSPLEFLRERVRGKILILSTTSGTTALIRAKEARWVLIGAFLNAGKVASKALEISENEGVNITLLLSGRKGLFSLEDFLCGGAVIERFNDEKVDLTDAALAALLSFESSRENLIENVLRTEHARRLVELGFRKDVEFSCQLDLYGIVPIYREGVIKLHPQSANSRKT
jgi:2-phosphosulfolactate phosphatase